MSISRRSLLRSLAALPAASSLTGLGQEATHSHANPCPSVPASSIFVLFEGPWLIYQSDPSNKLLTALTVGKSMPIHLCDVQRYRDCAVKPLSGLPSNLPEATSWTLNPANSSSAKDFTTAFANPFAYDQFPWVSKASLIDPHSPVIPNPDDRSVTLPLPTGIYVGGLLLYAQVKESVSGLLEANNVPPHIVTIFEYAPLTGSTSPVSMSLNTGDPTKPVQFTAGDHLVFRMRHSQCFTTPVELKHVQATFQNLVSHFKSRQSPLSLDINTDTDYRAGEHIAGIAESEMGLKHAKPIARCPLQDTYANCAGGGIIVGP